MLLVQAQAYREQYGFNAVYLIPVNSTAPTTTSTREQPRHPRPDPQVHRGQGARRYRSHRLGTGSASREFLYVEDAAEGIALATERYDGDEPVNLGAGGVKYHIRDLTETIGRLVGFQGIVRWDTTQPDGQPRRMLDTSRARDLFGFEAQPASRRPQKNIDWYETHLPLKRFTKRDRKQCNL